MPTFAWKGINQTGTAVKGVVQANSIDQLQEQLLQQGIALLHVSPLSQKKPFFFLHLTRSISAQDRCEFFENLALLINQGIELAKALNILSHETTNRTLRAIIENIATSIHQGNSLQTALQAYPQYFSPHLTQLVGVGEKTGKLGYILEILKNHLVSHENLKRQFKHAALMPLITLTISLGLVCSIIIFVVPHFAALYKSMSTPLPRMTQNILDVSLWLKSWKGLVALSGLITSIILLRKVAVIKIIKPYTDYVALKLPVLNACIIYRDVINFLQTLHLYVVSGLPLTVALDQAELGTQNINFKNHLVILRHSIMEGKTLSDALESIGKPFFDAHLTALIRVGEHAGRLADVLEKALQRYQQKLSSTLHVITTFFAPCLMIIVGLCIGGLMIMLYLPIFNLGSLIGR